MIDDATSASEPIIPRISYSPTSAAVATNRSRTRIFMAIKNKELTARKDGRATLIEADELRRWVRSLPSIGRDPASERADVVAA